MNLTKEQVLRITKLVYPDIPVDDLHVRETKQGDWVIGFVNDYPMQHGSGVKQVIPKELLELTNNLLESKNK